MEIKTKIKKQIHKSYNNRFIEIDLLRGFAIFLMVFGHILWDLDYYNIIPLNNDVYSIFQKTAPPLFFLLVGMCTIIGYKKKEFCSAQEENNFFKHATIRGFKILGLGIALSIITMIFIPERPIMFGVLHCIGLSIILSVPFIKYRKYNPLFSVGFIYAGILINNCVVQKPTVFHLIVGLHQAETWRYTIDYFPLLPWFGVCLLGIVIGDWFYCSDKRIFRMPNITKYRPARIFSWLGQHSLGIYLLHQPIIAGAIILYGHL